MTPTETITILRQFNEWRRGEGEDLQMPKPREIGKAIDAAVEMIDRLEAAERERDAAELMSLALRAKIEQMERQKPVAWAATDETCRIVEALSFNQSRRFDTPLYALPGTQTQPAPSVPGINEGVRKVTLGFRWESEAQHHIPTIEIEFDPVSPDSPNDANGWQDRDRIAVMLTPEAKP